MADKRIKDVEDSVRAIAEYVKQQNALLEKKMNEKISKIVPDDDLLVSKNLHEDVAELRKKLDSISSEKHISPMKMKSIEDFEERITGRMDKIEEHVANIRSADSGKIEQRVGGTVSSIRKEFDDFRHDVVPKIHFIEGKLNKMKDDLDEIAASSNVDDIREKLESVDRKLNKSLEIQRQIDEIEKSVKAVKDFDRRLGKVEQLDPSAIRSDMMALAKEVDARLRATDERIVKRDTEEFKKIYDEIAGQFLTESTAIRKLVEDFDRARSQLESRMKGTETRLMNKENEESKRIQEEVGKQLRAESLAIKKEMDEFVRSKSELEMQLKSLENRLLKKESEDLRTIQSEVGNQLRNEGLLIKKQMEDFTRTKGELENKIRMMETRLSGKENAEFKRIYEDFTKKFRDEASLQSHERTGLEERIRNIETRVSKKETDDFERLYERVSAQLKDEAASMKKEIIEFQHARSNLEEKINAMNTVLTQRQVADSKRILDEIEEKTRQLNKNIEHFDQNYAASVSRLQNEVDRRVKSLEVAEKEEIKRLIESVDRRMKSADEHKAGLQRFTEDSTKKMREDLERRMRNVEEHKLGFDNDSVRRLEEEAAKIRQLMDKEAVNRIVTEKKIAELESAMAITSGDSKAAENFRRRIEAIEAQLASSKGGHGQPHVATPQLLKIEEELENTKRALDNEAAVRLAMEKKLQDIEMMNREMREKLEGISHVEELSNLGSRIHDMEKNVKMSSVRLLTQQLNDFAKSMDRKMPNIVPREEYLREVAEINRRLKTIESPDLAPLGNRVERLEHKIDEISHMLRGLHNRVPVVVE